MGSLVRLGPTNDPLSSAKRRPPKWTNRKCSLCSLKFIVCLVRELCARSRSKVFRFLSRILGSNLALYAMIFYRRIFGDYTGCFKTVHHIHVKSSNIFVVFLIVYIIMIDACLDYIEECFVNPFLFSIVNPYTTCIFLSLSLTYTSVERQEYARAP